MSNFRVVSRQKIKASIMIEGIQGTGKSGLALVLARALASDWDKVFAIDTENKSLDLFDGIKTHTADAFGNFVKADLTVDAGYAPSNYMKLREQAIEAGAEVVVMDSISHMWNRKGGLLDKVSEAQQAGLDNYRAWGTDENREEKEIIFDIVRSDKAHIITTVRSKEKFGLEFDDTRNKHKVVSLGEQQIMQDGLKYEPDLVLRMIQAGNMDGTNPRAEVLKSRYPIFKVGEEYEFTKELIDQLKVYLQEGVDPEEILKLQKEELIKAVKEYCNTPARKSLWQQLKSDTGFTGKIEDMDYKLLKDIYRTLTSE